MSWDQIAQDPEFQALPEERRGRIRANYFQTRIAPNVPAEKLEQVRSSFLGEETTPTATPVPSARDQYVKAAGQLIAHATLAAKKATETAAKPIMSMMDEAGKAAAGATEKLGLPNIDSPGIVDRLSKAAHEAAIQFGIKPTDEEKIENPTIAALGITRPLRAYQTLIDRMLPEVAALKPWFDLKEKPLTDKIDTVLNRQNEQSKLAIAAIAPVETTNKELPKFDLARRAIAETGQQLLHGGLTGLRAMMNPVNFLEAEALGRATGAGIRGAANVVARSASEASLRAQLSPVTAIGEDSLAHLTKAPEDLTPMDHVHRHVQGTTNAILEGVQERTGASPAAMQAAARELDSAGYEQMFRQLNGLHPGAQPPSAGLRALMARPAEAPEAVPGPVGLLGAPEAEGGAGAPAAPRPLPTAPHEVASEVAAAGVLNPTAAKVAQDYPSLYAAATGSEVPRAALAEVEAVVADLRGRGVPDGSLIDMLKAGVATGKASFVRLAKANDALLTAALQEQGAHPQTLARHAADAYAAAQRPAETVVIHQMEVEAQKAAVEARAQATQDVWEEAHRTLQEHTPPPAPAAAPESGAAPEAAPIPLPGRAETLAHAEEAGMPLEEAAEAHRQAALAAQADGTLDPGIAQEYHEAGDDSFDVKTLEDEQHPFPNLAKHPAEMTLAEFKAEYPGMEDDTHRALVEEAQAKRVEEARKDVAANLAASGVKAQPIHDLLRQFPIGEKWLKELGLQGEFRAFKGRGLVVKGGNSDQQVDKALGRAIEAGLLPEGSTINDLVDALDHEARKGTKAEASLVKDEPPAPAMVADAGFDEQGGQGFLFDEKGNVNLEAVAPPTEIPETTRPAPPGQEGLPLTAAPEGPRAPVLEPKESTAPARKAAPKKAGEITDTGEELWYNRRNLIGKGLKWDDIRALNPTLKALEVQKAKVWPRPDYEALIQGGLQPLTAHLVKQVYDSISTKPNVSGTPTDAQMEAYVNEVARIKDAVFEWAKDPGTQRALLEKLAGAAKARLQRGPVSISSLLGGGADSEGLLDRLYPEDPRTGSRWGHDNQAQNDLVLLVGGRKVADAMRVDLESATDALKAIDQGWPAPQEAWQKRFEIREVPAGTRQWSREKGEHTTTEAHFEIKVRAQRGMMVRGEFPTREAAEAKARELATSKKVTRGLAEAALSEFVRQGPPQRPAGLDVTPKALQDKFGFRGINFGNYTDQGERQAFTNHAYDALLDLADVVRLPAPALSLNGTLGLAYGAQGRGGKYAAHFVPGLNEINLTKDAGAGALAHEWWHALDHYFAAQASEVLAKTKDPYLTHQVQAYMGPKGRFDGLRPEIIKAFNDLVEAMQKRTQTTEEVAAQEASYAKAAVGRLDRWLKHFRDRLETEGRRLYNVETRKTDDVTLTPKEEAIRANQLKQFDLLAEALRQGQMGEGWESIGRGPTSAVRQNVGEIRRLYKDITGHVPAPDDIKALDSSASALKFSLDAVAKREQTKPMMVGSNYARQARTLDGSKTLGYWSRETELGARAFQSYVLDKLEAEARRNDYLTRPQGAPADYATGDPYPRDAERTKINAAFDVLVNALKTRETPQGMMVYDEPPAPAPAFYSKLQKDVEAKMGKTATAEQVRALLRDQKAEEVAWSGIEEFLAGKEKIDKAELLDFLRANQLEVREVLKGVASGKAVTGQAASLRVRADGIARQLEAKGYEVTQDPYGMPGELELTRKSDGQPVGEDEDLPEDVNALAQEYSSVRRGIEEAEQGADVEGDTKFASYTLPGGKNYRELLLTLPAEGMETNPSGKGWDTRELSRIQAERAGKIFRSSHFDEPNILAHVRFDDRVANDAGFSVRNMASGNRGPAFETRAEAEAYQKSLPPNLKTEIVSAEIPKKTLFIEEIQSDWHQKGRRQGYGKQDYTPAIDALYAERRALVEGIGGTDHGDRGIGYDPTKLTAAQMARLENISHGIYDLQRKQRTGDTVPDAPLKKTWHEFAFKRMVRWAAEHGYDKVAWTTGEQQADRYDLSKQIDEVKAARQSDGTYHVTAIKDDKIAKIFDDVKEKDLAEIVGKDLAAKITAAPKPEPLTKDDVRRMQQIRKINDATRSKKEQAELDLLNQRDQGVTSFTGVDLKVGGEGMVGFYDKMLPDFARKFGKKFGATVSDVTIKHGEGKVNTAPNELHQIMEPVDAGSFKAHAMTITPEMRDAALGEGFSLFDRPSDETAKAYGPGVDMGDVQHQLVLDLDFGGAGEVRAEVAKRGRVNYVGKTVKGWQDVAEIVASMRHTLLEHQHFILARNGKIVAHKVVTSGLPDAVQVSGEQTMEIIALAEELGADAVYAGHNHPSGIPVPSIQDHGFDQKMRRYIPGYRGSLVTDGPEFTLIHPDQPPERIAFEKPQPEFYKPLGPSVYGDYQIAAAALKNGFTGRAHTVLYLDAWKQIMAVEHIELDADVPARVKAGVLRNKASQAAVVAPRPLQGVANLPSQAKSVVYVDADGKVQRGAKTWEQMQRGPSAYGETITSSFVADQPSEEALPRYMTGQGMDAGDFAKAIVEAKIQPGSPVTARVKFEGVPKGTKGKVLAIGQKTQTLMVQFEGEAVPHAVRAENLVETNRKPAARQAVEAAEKAAKVSGEPSLSIKKIIQQQQAGLSPAEAQGLDELGLLAEKFKNQAKGARYGAREATRQVRAQMDARVEAFQAKLSGMKDEVKFTKAEAQANADWLAAEQTAIRAEVVRYLQEALPPEARGKFITTVKNADTVAKLLFARQAIDEAAANIYKKGLLSDIRKLVPRILESPGVDVKAKEQIRAYLTDVELKGRSAATYARLRKTIDFLHRQEAVGEGIPISQALAEELDILGRRPLKDMSETELEGIFQRLQMLEDIGRTTVKVRQGLYLLERERIASEIQADLRPIDDSVVHRILAPVVGHGDQVPQGFKDLPLAAKIQNAIARKLDWAYDKYMAITPPDVVWDMLSKTPQYAGALVKHFAHGIGAAYARHIDLYDAPINKARAIIAKHGLTDEQIRIVTAYAYVRQPGMTAYLKNEARLSDAEIDSLVTIPKEGMELYNAWREALDAIYPMLKDTLRFNDNMEVGKRTNYFPVRFDPTRAIEADDDLAKMIRGLHEGFQKNVQMGNLQRRRGSKKVVALDGQQTFENYMRLAAYKVAMSRTVRMLGEIANSPEFQQGAGEFGGRFAKQFITMLARRGSPRANQVIPLLDNARRHGSVFAIVGRLPTAAVHMTLLTNAAAISGPGPIFGAMRDVMTADLSRDGSLEAFWRENDPVYRQNHGNDPVFQDAADEALWNGKEWWKALTTPTSLRWIVRKATLATLEGNYRVALAKRGLSRAGTINADALNEARLLTRRAIASPELPHMFLAYNSGDVLTGNLSGNRALTQFKNFPIDRWSTYVHDLPEMLKQGRYGAAASFVFWQTVGDFVEVGLRHGYKVALAAILGAGAVYEMDEDHRKFWDEFMIKLLEKPPFVADVLNMALYQRVPTTAASLIFDSATSAGAAFKAYKVAQTRRMYQKMTESLVDLAALAVPIPGGGVIEQAMRMIMADGGVRFPYDEERQKLNNLHKDGRALPEEEQRRALLNHVYTRYEKLNHAYKDALKRGEKERAEKILDGMKTLAHGAKP